MDIQLDNHSAHRHAKWLILLALGIFTLLCLWVFRLFTAEKVAQVPLANITLHPVQQGEFTDILVTRAVAIPSKSVMITAEQGGIVTEIRQNIANDVKQGEMIARLSNDDFVLQVASHIADVTEQINNLRNIRRLLEKDELETHLDWQDARYKTERLNKELIRQKGLYDHGSIAKANYEQLFDESVYWEKRYSILTTYQERQMTLYPSQLAEIESSLSSLGKLTQQLRNSLDKLTITAPIDGIISPLTLKVGQQVKLGAQIANLDNPDNYYFETSFSEYYLDKIKPKGKVIAHYGGNDIPLTITSVSSQVENGKFIARLALAHPQALSLKRGQSIDVHVLLRTAPDALHIPSNAIVAEDNGIWVYIYDKKNQRAIKTPIIIKRQGETESEIASGLSAGQQVVVFTGNRIEKSKIIEFK